MLVKITLKSKNQYPLTGVIIKSESPFEWLKALNALKFNLSNAVYALPGATANSIWGCLAIYNNEINKDQVYNHELCQRVSPLLYIPEMADISPKLSALEIEKLIGIEPHLYHPEIGLVQLSNPVKWNEMIPSPTKKLLIQSITEESVFIPQAIEGYFKQPMSLDEIEEKMTSPVTPEKLESKPLSLVEKMKLKAYKTILGSKGDATKDNSNAEGSTDGAGGKLMDGLFSALSSAFPNAENWMDGMAQDLEDLEKRNQNEVDKLLDLLKNNPEEALKYAIPLDQEGSMRGDGEGLFNMSKMWGDLSIFGTQRGGNGGGGSMTNMDHYVKLNQQYQASAKELLEQGKYEKAAFIYLKLLKDNHKAADALEKGKLYEQAAFIYLKYIKDKKKAAECYEKGLFYNEAIDLYLETKSYEKAGDLLATTNRFEEAKDQYSLLIEEYKSKQQYIKASLVYKYKLLDAEGGQSILLEGWKSMKDPSNCLQNYFNNIADEDECLAQIKYVQEEHTSKLNNLIYVHVLSKQFAKRENISSQIKHIAYEVISENAISHPAIIVELNHFNLDDKEIRYDVSNYQRARRDISNALNKIKR